MCSCNNTTQNAHGFCCDAAELTARRAVMQDVLAILEAEAGAPTLALADSSEALSLARLRLRTVARAGGDRGAAPARREAHA